MVSRAKVGSSSFPFSERRRRGFTLVELMVVVAVIALLAAIAIYNVLRARATTNETAAIANQRALISALEMYHASNGVYPGNWQVDMYEAAEPDYGPPAFNRDMAGSEVQGYLYTYTAQPDGCSTQCSGYTLSSVPATLGSTGSRALFVDETGILRHCRGGGPADATDQPIHLPPTDC